MSLTAPANNATVSGSVNVTANASDDVGVVGVQFKLDGANLGAEDTARGKPFPDGYLLAATRLDVAPAECLVLEDSTAGIRAAR